MKSDKKFWKCYYVNLLILHQTVWTENELIIKLVGKFIIEIFFQVR